MTPVSRRAFIATTLAAGTGLVIGFYLPHGSRSAGETFSPNAYLKIDREGKITVMVARSEMGQGVRTSLPMILAEELEAEWKQISIEQVGASTLYGDQTTGGSASVRTSWDPMRRAGAAAREMLITAAALAWQIPRSGCKAENGRVLRTGTSLSFGYGELVGRAATLPVPTEPVLKASKDYKIVGQRMARLDTPSKVVGTAVFGIDVRLPGMQHAVLARSPKIGGKLISFDGQAAKKIPGVRFVERISDSAVAVVADSTWSAIAGRRALTVKWDDGANKNLNSAEISEALKKAANQKAATLYTVGDSLSVSGRAIEAVFECPFMAHAPMEPGNTTAHFEGTKCEIWSPTQVPQDCRDSAAQALGLDPDQVKVNVTLMGGGFGRRLEHDYAVEAALVSKAVRAPVQVLWTREDDMQFSTYRPSSYHQLRALLDTHGWPASFHHRIVSGAISGQKGYPIEGNIDPDLRDEAALVYSFPHALVEYVMAETAVPLGWMRSVYALQVGFASECFLDELARASARDPLAYRLHLLAKDEAIRYFDALWQTARMRAVLQLAAEKANWGKPLAAGHFQGIACFGCFSSYAAEVVEISIENDRPRVHRVVAAIDCGQVVNPRILEQQVQGGVIFALANAMRAEITINQGAVVQTNFGDYAPIRMNEAPAVEAYFVPSTEAPTGVGEPCIPPLAPALYNAMFAATGKRLRSLPLLSALGSSPKT